MDAQPEFAPEYSRAERLRIVALGVVAGLAATLLRERWLIPQAQALTASASGRTALAYGLCVGLPLLIAGVVALSFGRRGWQALRAGQFPPPGMKVFQPTPIRRGEAARRIGMLHLAAVLVPLLTALWGATKARTLFPSPAPPPAHAPRPGP